MKFQSYYSLIFISPKPSPEPAKEFQSYYSLIFIHIDAFYLHEMKDFNPIMSVPNNCFYRQNL